MPEEQQQQPPLWQKKKAYIYFDTHKGPKDGEEAIRKLPSDDSSYCI